MRLNAGLARNTLVAVACALLLQSLAPPGYMAGSLSDGWPVVLCPEGLPGGFLGHDHHHHEDASAGNHAVSLDGHCPLGGVLDSTAAGLLAAAPAARLVSNDYLAAGYIAPHLIRLYRSHPTRAPPA